MGQAADWGAVVAGVALIGWSGLWVARKPTPIEPRHTLKVSIVTGPYWISRNAIYATLTIILAGAVWIQGALSPVSVSVAFGWIITQRVVLAEGGALRAAFDPAAGRYFHATRRWL